tara:strand:+ start:12833 stop:14503 length:1671 start_codon:yes stop_codon:yes gene_type:complete
MMPSTSGKQTRSDIECDGSTSKRRRQDSDKLTASLKHLPPFDDGCVWSLLCLPGGEYYFGIKTALYVHFNGRFALIAGHPDKGGYKDDHGMKARFGLITGIAKMPCGSLLLCDQDTHSLRSVNTNGYVTTLTGNGNKGFANGVLKAARFNQPESVQIDKRGMIYVADSQNHCIRLVNTKDNVVCTLCGNPGKNGFVDGFYTEACFNGPCSLDFDLNEDLIVADCGNDCVRKVSMADGRVTTIAGAPSTDEDSYFDGIGIEARFNSPNSVVVDGSNNILVADSDNHKIRKISGDGALVTTLPPLIHKTGRSFTMRSPVQLAINDQGQLWVTTFEDWANLIVVEASLVLPARLVPKKTEREIEMQLALDDYGKLLDDPALADVFFEVQGTTFFAHRSILTVRNEYFKAILLHGQEATLPTDVPIRISDIKATAFEIVLKFIYKNELPDMQEDTVALTLTELAQTADYMQASGLYKHCFEKFKVRLTCDTVIKNLIKVHDLSLVAYEQEAIRFLRKNARQFTEKEMDSLDAFQSRQDLMNLCLEVNKTISAELLGSDFE